MGQQVRRSSIVRAAALGATVFATLLVVAPHAGARAASVFGATPSTTNRAGVIVDEGNGVVRRVGITFSGTISGITALQDAGFAPTVRGFGSIGGAVCGIQVSGTTYGCPSDSTCLTCAAPDYWSYSRAPAGTQQFTTSGAGAGATHVQNGDIEGWRWGTGTNTPTYASLASFFPPPTTTTVPAPPVTSPHTTAPTHPKGPTTSAPTGPPVRDEQVPGVTNTTTTPGDPATTTTSRSSATGPGVTNTTASRGGGATGVTTDDPPNDARAGPTSAGTRRLAAAPPTVHSGSGSSPFAWIAFAAIVAAFAAAIVITHQRRARATG